MIPESKIETFMKVEKDEAAVKEKVKEEKAQAPPQLSVQEIINAYPNDREKARDTILAGIHNELNRIANAIEYFASQDVAEKKAKQISELDKG